MTRTPSPRASFKAFIPSLAVRIAAAAMLVSTGIAFAASPPGPTAANPDSTALNASVITPDGTPASRPPDTAAIVNGHTITLSQVTEIVMRQDAANITSNLIDNYLVDAECQKRGITVPQSLIDDSVNGLAKAIAPETLDEGLKQHHQTLAQLQDDIRHTLERDALVMDKVQPTHMVHCKAILIRFTAPNQQQPAQFTPHTDAEAIGIVTEVQKQLKAGKEFSALATQYSEDTYSKDKGGDVGLTYDGANLDQDLIRSALSLKTGEITPTPVKVAYGYYLIQVVSTSDDHPKDEDSSYADAEEKYRRQQAEYLVPQYLKDLRAQAKIVNYIP